MGLALIAIRVIKGNIIHTAHNHDDWAWFRIWFAVTTVTAAIVFNMGIFTLLVSMHMSLDAIKYKTKHNLNWYWTMVETMRESLVDIFFISLGLFLSTAFHHTLAIGGLGRVAGLEIIMLEFVLRVGPRVKIAEHLLEIALYWKHHFEKAFVPREPLSRSEFITILATIAVTTGIFVIPFFTSLTWKDVAGTMRYELTPRLEFGITHTIKHFRSK